MSRRLAATIALAAALTLAGAALSVVAQLIR